MRYHTNQYIPTGHKWIYKLPTNITSQRSVIIAQTLFSNFFCNSNHNNNLRQQSTLWLVMGLHYGNYFLVWVVSQVHDSRTEVAPTTLNRLQAKQ